jgi:predicted HicB family RNase H-like nuclease
MKASVRATKKEEVLNVKVSVALHKKIKRKAKEQQTTMSTVVRQACAKLLEEK